jgi:hypothetical protein
MNGRANAGIGPRRGMPITIVIAPFSAEENSPMSVRVLVVCLLLVQALARPVGAAQSAAPAAKRDQPPEDGPTQPVAPLERTARPAPVAVPNDADPATPKGSLKLLATALRDGDADGIRQVMHAANPSEVRMVAAMADMAKAMAVLQKAAVRAFGEEGAKEVIGDSRATDADGRARIDSADVRVQGDVATVTMPEGEDAPVVLRKVNGRWKVPMAELSRNADPAALDERLVELAEQAKLVQQIAAEIDEGQFTSPGQAYSAWQSRAMQAVTRRPVTTKPRQDQAKPAQGKSSEEGASARPAAGNTSTPVEK